MPDTMTFEEAQQAQPDTLTFEEAAGLPSQEEVAKRFKQLGDDFQPGYGREFKELGDIAMQPLVSKDTPGIGGAVRNFEDTLEAGESPMIFQSPAARAAAGFARGTVGAAEGFTSPAGIATMAYKAPAAIRGVLGAAFAIMGIKQAGEAYQPLKDAIAAKDWGKAAELATTIVSGGAQAALGAHGFAEGAKGTVEAIRGTPDVPQKTLAPNVNVEQSGNGIKALQMRGDKTAGAEKLSEMSRQSLQDLEAIPQDERTPAKEKQLQELRSSIRQKGEDKEAVFSSVPESNIGDASQRLQQSASSDVALSQTSSGDSSDIATPIPPEVTAAAPILPKAAAAAVEAIQNPPPEETPNADTTPEESPVPEKLPAPPVQEGVPTGGQANAPVEAPASAQPKVAPVVFRGTQQGFGTMPAMDLYNLTEDVPGLGVKGSTLAERTIRKAGYEVPPKPAAEAPVEAPPPQAALPPQPETPPVPIKAADAPIVDQPVKYQIGKSPQTFSLVEKIPASETEKANGEQAVKVKNDKTGETQTVLESQLRTVKPKMAGPGSPSIGQGPDPKAQIEQLEESLRNIEGQKVPFRQKVKEAFKVGQIASTAQDAVSGALNGLRTSGQILKNRWNGVETIDDMNRAKGELSEALETRGWRLRQFENTVRKAIPNVKERAAISKYVDAGGDKAELQRGLTEAPPQYKQAYQDALNFTPEQIKAAENIRNYFDSRLQEAQDAGVLEQGVEDYIHRIYEKDPAKQAKALAYVQSGILSKNPNLAKQRVFQFDWEAENLGYKPVQDFLPRLTTYESSLSKAIAAREFIKKATDLKAKDGRPVIDVKGVGIPVNDASGVREATLIKPKFNPAKANDPGDAMNYRGDYVNREYSALSKWKWVGEDAAGKPIYVQGDVAIHPDFVGRVDALLEPSRLRYGRYSGVTRPLLNIGSTVKSTMLDFSGFHQVQLAVHALEHRVNPLHLDKTIDFENPDVNSLLKAGVTLGGDYRMSSEGVFGSSLSKLLPVIGPVMETYHHWLFQDFIPRLKMTMAQEALARNRERFRGQMSDEQIVQKTANQANAAFGEQNYITMERSKTAQDMARLILLAPDFLESRAKFVGQAMEKGGKNFGNEQRTALFLGALTMYATARALNYAVSGQAHTELENMFSVVYNGKSYGLRTIQGDILHLMTDPVSFWLHRLNPVVTRPLLEAATGRDEFGRKRDFMQQVWDDVSVIAPVSLRNSPEKSIYESLSNGFGVTAKRYNATDQAFELAKAWKAKNGVQEKGEFIYDRDKDPLRPLKLALVNGDDGAAAAQIKKLVQSKQYSIGKLQTYFNRYANMPFTGSHANDAKFLKTLTDDQKKTVEAARQSKKDVRKLFLKSEAQYRQALQTPPNAVN